MVTLARSMFDFVITVLRHQWCCENWQDKQKVIVFVDLNEFWRLDWPQRLQQLRIVQLVASKMCTHRRHKLLMLWVLV